MNNKQKLITAGICAVPIVILAAIGANLPENREEEPVSVTTSTITEPSEHGTSQYVDYIYYKAKEDAVTATDEDLQAALTWLKENTENYFSSQEYMELTMYYGELLEMKYKGTNNEYEKLGWQAYKTIKFVYREVESVSDEATQDNLNELKEMVLNVEDIK